MVSISKLELSLVLTSTAMVPEPLPGTLPLIFVLPGHTVTAFLPRVTRREGPSGFAGIAENSPLRLEVPPSTTRIDLPEIRTTGAIAVVPLKLNVQVELVTPIEAQTEVAALLPLLLLARDRVNVFLRALRITTHQSTLPTLQLACENRRYSDPRPPEYVDPPQNFSASALSLFPVKSAEVRGVAPTGSTIGPFSLSVSGLSGSASAGIAGIIDGAAVWEEIRSLTTNPRLLDRCFAGEVFLAAQAALDDGDHLKALVFGAMSLELFVAAHQRNPWGRLAEKKRKQGGDPNWTAKDVRVASDFHYLHLAAQATAPTTSLSKIAYPDPRMSCAAICPDLIALCKAYNSLKHEISFLDIGKPANLSTRDKVAVYLTALERGIRLIEGYSLTFPKAETDEADAPQGQGQIP